MNLFLILHISGAIIVGFMSLFALVVLSSKQAKFFRFSALSIAVGGVLQVISGSLLALQMEGTLFAFCARVSVYLLAMVIIEGMLFVAMQKQNLVFPVRQVVFAFSLCLLLTVWTGMSLVS